MKTSIFFPLLFLSLFEANAQEFKQVNANSEIKSVTVYLTGAQITRESTSQLTTGKYIITLSGLSPHVDAKSIQVKGEGDFTILSVNHRFNYLNELKKDDRIDSLNKKANELLKNINSKNSRLEILAVKLSLLLENKQLNTETKSVSLGEMQQTLTFFENNLEKIKLEELKVKNEIDELKIMRSKILNQVDDIQSNQERPSSEIDIRIESETSGKAKLKVSYLVENAGWFPKYDIRVENVNKPIDLIYQAQVHQNTGVNWNNVKLTFSNATPNQSGVAPELSTWYLNFTRYTRFQDGMGSVYAYNRSNNSISGKVVSAEDGSPLSGVNVVIKGTTVGTVTDLQGNYTLTLPNNANKLVFSFIGLATEEVAIGSKSIIDIQMYEDVQHLSEVVVTGLQGKAPGVRVRGNSSVKQEAPTIVTRTIENQTTIEFEVDRPYSIKSNGEPITVALKKYDIPAAYKYYAVPKLDKDAFLIARVIDWNKYNLLEGEANLYLEDAYVGKTILNAKSLNDTLDISLGRDKSIVVGRVKQEDFSKSRTLGLNKVESRSFEIIVKNNKSQPINIILFDQVPVSTNSSIDVEVTELSSGNIEEATGEIKWELTMEGGQQKTIPFGYEVKYPKNEKVILE